VYVCYYGNQCEKSPKLLIVSLQSLLLAGCIVFNFCVMHVFVLCVTMVTEKLRQIDENVATLMDERDSLLAELGQVQQSDSKTQVRHTSTSSVQTCTI